LLPDSEGATGDPYPFKALIERLNRAADNFESTTRPARGMEADLEKLRALVRKASYAQAAKLLATIIPSRLAQFDAQTRTEVLGAAALTSTALLSKPRRTPVESNLARVAVFNPVLDRMLGELPPGTVWCIGSRSDQVGYETSVGNVLHGAFTATFFKNLVRPQPDLDGDGAISVLECAIATAEELAGKPETPQIPVVVGDADRLALFGAKRGVKPVHGVLRALLIGVGEYAQPMSLQGRREPSRASIVGDIGGTETSHSRSACVSQPPRRPLSGDDFSFGRLKRVRGARLSRRKQTS